MHTSAKLWVDGTVGCMCTEVVYVCVYRRSMGVGVSYACNTGCLAQCVGVIMHTYVCYCSVCAVNVCTYTECSGCHVYSSGSHISKNN